MRERLYLQRRRLLLHALIAFGCAISLRGSAAVDGMMLIQIGSVLALTVLVLRFAASFRFVVDLLLIMVLLFQIGGQISIALGLVAGDATTNSDVLLGWLVQLLVFVLAALAARGALSARAPGTFSTRASRIIALPPRRVWALYGNAEGQPWGPAVDRIEGEFGIGLTRTVHNLGKTEDDPGIHTETILDMVPDQSITKQAEMKATKNIPELNIITAFTVTEADGGTLIDVREDVDGFPLAFAISAWIDDFLQDDLAHFAALVEGRQDWSVKGDMVREVQKLDAEGF